VSPALRRAFGLFRLPPPADGASADATTTTAPASAAPPLPPIIESGLLAPAPMMEPYQLDVGATQGVTVDGHPVWVTPGVGGGCLDWTSQGLYGATNYSGVCGSTAQLDAGQLRGTSGNTPIQLAHTEPGYTFELVGLAPDASGDTVTALEPDGSELSLPVVDNVYVWVGPGPMLPDSITLVAANGATTNDTIGPAQ
jgi:hypothetical protein